ncbi:MAG: hypothetical protein K6F32_00505 [Bacilli bacterium]|nr:hypothetical protein [Bacilli bacterium]
MVATVIIAICIGLYLAGFAFFEIRRRLKGKRSFFTEDQCSCKTMNGRRMVAMYRKQKKAEMGK